MPIGRTPQTPTSEKRVLARFILRGKREQSAALVSEEDFTSIYRKKIFQAYVNVSRRLPEFDYDNILNEAKLLLKGGEYEQDQLVLAMNECCKDGGAPDIDEEIANLKRYTKKRKLLEFADEAVASSKNPDPDITQLIDKLANLQAGGVKVKSFDSVIDDVLLLLKARWQNGQQLMGLDTTIENINKATGGIMGGEIAIIAGRPGSGKTSLMIQQVAENLKRDKKIAYFSLEMQEVEVMEKILSYELKINSRLVSAPTDDFMKTRIEHKAGQIKTWPLKLFDNVFSINEIINTCWFLKETTGLDAVFIDYLQLIDAGKKQFQSDNSSVAYVSRMLKVLAQQLKVPIIVGCQLNRRTDLREDQSPRLSDLRDSGAIEQDASMVMAMHFHEIKDDEKSKGTGKWRTDGILLLKNRRGNANFECEVQFSPETSTFTATLYSYAVSIFGEGGESAN